MFYFVALYRIHANEKISAPVCWVQLSGPAVILYGFTIFGQPGSDEDELEFLIPENKEHFLRVHRRYFMPFMHIFFACCMISMVSALYCLKTRWKKFREKEFSPAHIGFCAPLVSHANAMQAYRAALNKFSVTPPDIPPMASLLFSVHCDGHASFFLLISSFLRLHAHMFNRFQIWLYRYWTLSLISGTVLIVIMTWKFFIFLPKWCQIDVEDDEIPPEPEETIVTRLLQKGEARDEINQDFVSAAVLQANESGALVRVLRDGKMKYVRSRRMPSMGFDPIMNTSELTSERDRLLQSVAYAAPVRDRGGINSFDDTLSDSFSNETNRSRASSRRNRLNFLSFDASTMMRGDRHQNSL